jgi:hypothetical protein
MMSDNPIRQSAQTPHSWENMAPQQVLAALVYELYNPVSTLGSLMNRIKGDQDLLTEEDTEAILEQMQTVVRQLSKIVVNLKRYTQDQDQESSPPSQA